MIALFNEMNCIFVVILKRSDQTCLRRQLSVALQVVDDDLSVGIAFVLQFHEAPVLRLVDLAVHLLQMKDIVKNS